MDEFVIKTTKHTYIVEAIDNYIATARDKDAKCYTNKVPRDIKLVAKAQGFKWALYNADTLNNMLLGGKK